MKTIIIYDSLHGFTKTCAEYLKEKHPDADLYELQSKEYKLEEYEYIIFGTYIYVGEVSKEANAFLHKNKIQLLKKPLGMFCSGLDKEDYLNALQTSLLPEIFYHAKIVCPGGRVILDNLSFFEKRKIKKRISITKDTYEFYPEKLDELIKKDWISWFSPFFEFDYPI